MTAEPIGDAALAEVVRLAEGATEGPWRVQPERRDEWEVPFEPVTDSGGNVIAHAYDCHAAFIAAANPATVLAMGARITAAEATLAKVQRSAGRVSREAVERAIRRSYGQIARTPISDEMWSEHWTWYLRGKGKGQSADYSNVAEAERHALGTIAALGLEMEGDDAAPR